MSSLKALQTQKDAPRTHSLVYEIKEACWWLKNNGYEIHLLWIPSHMVVRGNERTDQLVGDAMENGIEGTENYLSLIFRKINYFVHIS
jgi:ribonuclease HI